MELYFKSNKIKKVCLESKVAIAELGEQRARKLFQRLSEFRAADSLQVVKSLPAARLHPLIGNRKGEFAVDLAQPYRLIFLPYECEDPTDYKNIIAIEIQEIVDYH